MRETHIILQAKTENCRMEVWINGVPVLYLGPGHGDNVIGQPLAEYVVKGKNRLQVVLNPGPTPAEVTSGSRTLPTAGIRAGVQILRALTGSIAGQGGEHVGGVVRQFPPEMPTASFPLTIEEQFQVWEAPESWSWQQGMYLRLTPETQIQVEQTLHIIRRALELGDPDPIIELAGPYLGDRDLAFETAPDLQVAQFDLAISSLGYGDWKWVLPPRNEWSLRLCGDGRLLDCIAADWHPLLRTEPNEDGEVLYFHTLLGHLNGAWQLVRG
jgi:hypothetical protein